jgi:hypothetical protein
MKKDDLKKVSGGSNKPEFNVSFNPNSSISAGEGMYFVDNSKVEIDNTSHEASIVYNYLG